MVDATFVLSLHGPTRHSQIREDAMLHHSRRLSPATAAGSLGFAAVLLFMLGASMAGGQTSDPLAQKAPEAAELVAIAQRDGHVRVILTFDPPLPPDQVKPDPATISIIKAGVASRQDAIIADHFGSAASPAAGKGFNRGLSRFEITPGFAINVSLAELKALAADPRVRSLALDRAVAPSR
jgi:hypothetical protein